MSKERSIQNDTYKGYEIQAAPYQLADSGEWEVNFCIFHDRGYETRSRGFSSANSFKAQDKAIACCFYVGKQIIDGKIENCSVEGLRRPEPTKINNAWPWTLESQIIFSIPVLTIRSMLRWTKPQWS